MPWGQSGPKCNLSGGSGSGGLDAGGNTSQSLQVPDSNVQLLRSAAGGTVKDRTVVFLQAVTTSELK